MTSGGARHRVAAAEEGRRRVAREIHDDYSQRLAALALTLQAVCKALPEGGPPRAELDAACGGLADLGEDLRRLSHDLHPAALERRGLAVALRDHCAEIERRHDLRVDLSLKGVGGSFPPEIALGLYRIVQEALANTVRHAGARNAVVTLRATASTARLTVTDDGRGFDPDAARRNGGIGLASLEERAQLLGGRCRITSAPGDGTRIEAAVPLPDGSALSQLREMVRRHRGPVIAAALVILALAAGLVTTLVQARRARQEAARADAAARFLEGLFQASDPRQARGHPPGARELLRRGSQRLRHELRDQPLLRARLLDTLGGIDTELGLYDDARPLLTEALTLRERLRGKRSPEVADTLVRLGALARLSGQGDAIPLFQRALAIREDRLGPGNPEVADVLGKLGTAFAAKGRFAEAEAALRRALALGERLWGKNDPRVAKVLHNLSGIAYYRDDTAEYERLLQRALAIREAALPPDDLDLAGSREAMALLRLKQDRPAEAARLLERLAATYERVYGPQHPELAKTLLNLGLARAGLRQDEEARQLFERALAITERSLAPDHPQHVRALATLANFYFARERRAEATPLYQKLLALHAQGAPYDDWDKVIANARRCSSSQSAQAPPGTSIPGGRLRPGDDRLRPRRLCLLSHGRGPSSRNGPTFPRESWPVPGNGRAIPRNGSTLPRSGPSVPRNGPTFPRESRPVPGNGPGIPRNGSTFPRPGPSVPRNGSTFPRESWPVPGNSPAIPRNGSTLPRPGPSVPRNGPRIPRESWLIPRNGPGIPRSGLSHFYNNSSPRI